MEFDLVLLHPPSFYDFRKNNQFRGPISDVVPSSSVFDMYPIGFTSIAGYLERFGHRVKIVNLAARMVHNRRFDAEKKIRGLKSAAFGISLHWLPHAQGSIEIAKLVKKYHPDVPVIFGGLSSTYYHRELMQHDCVDFVMRGDSTEGAMLTLMDEIKSGAVDFSTVPNLTWKRDGKVFVNPISAPPLNLDDIDIPDYRYAMRSVFQYRSLLDALPYEGWLSYPLSALLTTRGCTQDCALCGGSRSAYSFNCSRTKPSMRSPIKLLQDIQCIQRFCRTPIFVIGDIRQGGTKYVDEFLERVCDLRPTNELVFELFWGADDDFFEKVERTVRKYSLEITLESADEDVRRKNGKFPCTNQEIIQLVRSALDHGCRKLDIFFMVGLPHQTYESAMRNIDFCEEIHRACDYDKRLCYFVAPLAPFLDPASRAFEHPEQFGLKRLSRYARGSHPAFFRAIVGVHSELRNRFADARANRQDHVRQPGQTQQLQAAIWPDRARCTCQDRRRNCRLPRLHGTGAKCSARWNAFGRIATIYRGGTRHNPDPTGVTLEGEASLSQSVFALHGGNEIIGGRRPRHGDAARIPAAVGWPAHRHTPPSPSRNCLRLR